MRTSKQAYKEILDSGLLSHLQAVVYAYLAEHGPKSQRDVWQKAAPGRERHSIGPRFAELEAAGLITIHGTTEDKSTGKTVYTYAVTPKDRLDKRPSDYLFMDRTKKALAAKNTPDTAKHIEAVEKAKAVVYLVEREQRLMGDMFLSAKLKKAVAVFHTAVAAAEGM